MCDDSFPSLVSRGNPALQLWSQDQQDGQQLQHSLVQNILKDTPKLSRKVGGFALHMY